MKAILWFSVMLAAALYICGPVIDPDLWWHITAGRWILANQAIPHVDYWNMFGAGKPWRAYSWSVEVLFAWVDSHFDIRGLLILQMGMAVLVSFSLFYCLGKISRDWFVGALLGLWATLGCFNHFTLRPQTLVWVYFIWLILVVDSIETRGASRGRFAALFLIMVLWANTHLTSALAILTIVGWLWRKDHVKQALQAGGFAFLGSLVTPYLGGEWITLFMKSGHPFQHQDIAEFQSATIMQYSTAFLIIILVVMLAFLHHRPKTVHVAKLFVAALFVAAGLAIVKFLPFAIIYCAAVVAAIWHSERADRRVLGNLSEAVERFRAGFHKIPREGLSFVCICLAIMYAVRPWREPLNYDIVPVAAVDFMQKKDLPLPILNEFGRGGYLMYRYSDAAGNPRYLVPIDGRTNVTPHDVFGEFEAALTGKYNWKSYLDRVKPETILWPTESPLVAILLEGTAWCQVFATGDKEMGYTVFVKRSYWEKHQDDLESTNCKSDIAVP
ncbi:MAG: hypothetical protein J0M12_04730 [Deltaproteobacteria bacterium]|nr:hypothetical protein [Deltaproteobacteria bacterium]